MIGDMYNPNRYPMRHAKPADGIAYSNLELEAIMHIPVDVKKDVLMGPMQARYDFFEHASRLAINPAREQDQETVKLIVRALLAEVEDPPIFNLGDFYEVREDDVM